MTSENEIGWNESIGNLRKLFYLKNKMQKDNDNAKLTNYGMLLSNQIFFHENFMLFSISKTRTIALVNPFFRLYFEYDGLEVEKPNINLTMIKDINIFEKNKANYKEKGFKQKNIFRK